MNHQHRLTVAGCAELLATMRERAPRVHCITNAVAMPFTANLLLAAGAVPSMSIAPDEIRQFAAGCDALLVNLGTLDEMRKQAIDVAVAQVTADQRPWVLDPVLVDRVAARRIYATDLCRRRPAVIRGNRAEIEALAGTADDALQTLARSTGAVIASSGNEDQVGDGTHVYRVTNGSPLMAQVTAVGCAASALLAAFLTVSPGPAAAAVATLLTVGVAGEIAAQRSRGPGSFQAELLDALAGLSAADLQQRGKLA